MKKIPCLFQRDFSNPQEGIKLLQGVTPGCEWVLAGEGVATRKWDGRPCLVQGGKLYTRYDCKKGRVPPLGAIPCDAEPDPVTGHWPHWVEAARPEDKWIREAFDYSTRAAVHQNRELPEGTYEAIGPHINGNHEAWSAHVLMRHGTIREEAPRTFAGLDAFLGAAHMEGIVFHHPDGRMAKIRRDDFMHPWPVLTLCRTE